MPGTQHHRAFRFVAAGRSALRDTLAGLVASVILITNIVSFGALMFPGDLSPGVPVAIWAMLIGSCVGGLCIALTTSLPPFATGIDSPTVAALALLGALTASSVKAAGADPQAAAQSAMLIFTVATLLSGALLVGLGAFRWGSYLRFVPYPVVGGFLAAAGCFLIAGAVRMLANRIDFAPASLSDWTLSQSAKFAIAVLVFGTLVSLRRWVKAPFALPATLIAIWIATIAALRLLGLSGAEHGWYLKSFGALISWSPFEAARTSHLTWQMLIQLVPQLLAAAIVALVSLVTKISSIEVGRRTAGNLDHELLGHGIASIIAAPLGGLMCSVQPSSSRLLEQAGGATRMSGVVCAATFGVVGLANLDLPGWIPIPIIAGVLLYLGYSFIADAAWRPYSQRAWLELSLTVGIAVVCIRHGYVIGVLAGLICACMLFVVSYARLGVVRRHLTRAQFSSYVDRSARANEHLSAVGDAIHVYWLSGYIFFGSSERLFERIRNDIEAALPHRIEYIILDFGMVSGADSSAYVSLTKLRDHCDRRNTTILYCSLARERRAALERNGFIGSGSPHKAVTDLNVALAWCEDNLLAAASIDVDMDIGSFMFWLQGQLGANANATDLIGYFERRDLDASSVLYRQGEASDTIDLVAAGDLAIDVAPRGGGETLRVRRIATCSVIGEIGFFGRSARSATISSEGPTTIFTLTRDNFERMRREQPDLATAFEEFMIRIVSDRIISRDREVSALKTLTE